MSKRKPKWKEIPVLRASETKGITTLYRRDDGPLLLRRKNGRFIQWELLDLHEKPLLAQLELPGMPDVGAPFTWADEHLA